MKESKPIKFDQSGGRSLPRRWQCNSVTARSFRHFAIESLEDRCMLANQTPPVLFYQPVSKYGNDNEWPDITADNDGRDSVAVDLYPAGTQQQNLESPVVSSTGPRGGISTAAENISISYNGTTTYFNVAVSETVGSSTETDGTLQAEVFANVYVPSNASGVQITGSTSFNSNGAEEPSGVTPDYGVEDQIRYGSTPTSPSYRDVEVGGQAQGDANFSLILEHSSYDTHDAFGNPLETELFNGVLYDFVGTLDALSVMTRISRGAVDARLSVATTFAVTALDSLPVEHLAFAQQPTDTLGATPINKVAVVVQDAAGNIITSDNSEITVEAEGGPSNNLAGTLIEPAVNGVATFFDLSLDEGGKYMLQATDGDLTAATSTSFIVTPPLLSLAKLSGDAYSASPTGDGATFKYDGLSPGEGGLDSNNKGYVADAYIQADDAGTPSEVVIAVRGTVISPLFHPLETLKHVVADLSFGSTTPSSALESEVSDLINFINHIESLDPGVPIVLTGHSLGGAVVQLVGEASGMPTVAFNAPGAAQLVGPLSTQLSAIDHTGSGVINVNYRIWGDQISLFGTSFPQTVTMAAPADTTFPGIIAEVTLPAYFVIDSVLTFLHLHKIDTVIAQIEATGGAPTPSDGQPNVAQYIEDLVQPVRSVIPTPGSIFDYFVVKVASGVGLLVDPTEGSDFVLTAQAGSPDFASFDLPDMSGVKSYKIRYETAGIWSAFRGLNPGVEYDFVSNVDGVEFEPVNSNGELVTVSDAFLFGAAFASTGTFSGTLEISGATEPVTGSDESSIVLATSAASVQAGDAVTFTATISSPFAPGTGPTGTVSFLDADGDALGTSPVASDGTAVFSTKSLPVGVDDISAAYSGDSVYADSISSVLSQTVVASPPSNIVPTLNKIVLSASAIAGQKLRASVSVTIRNTGGKLAGLYTVKIFVGDGDTLDGSEVLVATESKKLSLRADNSAAFNFNLKSLPAMLPDGTYHVLVEVIDPTGLGNAIAAAQTIQVASPFVSLTSSVVTVKPATVKPGKFGSTVVTLTNNGNVAAVGQVTLTVSLSSDGVTALPSTLLSIKRYASIKPGRTAHITLRFRLNSSVMAGVYFPFVTAALAGGVTTSIGPNFEVG